MEQFLKYKITDIGGLDISVYNIVISIITLILTWIVLIIIKKLIYRVDKLNEGRKYALYRIVKYIALVTAIILILKIYGVDITLFIAGSAALLVGLGLGIQSLFLDFISGIELLIEGSIKVDDVIEVEGMIAKVKEIGLRTSYVLTNDGIYIIVPNSVLTSNKLINWTHSEIKSRFHIPVGISYSSDAEKAMKIMVDCSLKNPFVDKEPIPYVRLQDFGNSAIMLDLLFWSKEVFRIDDVKSEIRIAVYKQFNENNIVIPFPQRTLHFNSSELPKK